MSHNVKIVEVRTARRARVKPTIADLKNFIADAEAAGIADTRQVKIEHVTEILGYTYNLSAEQTDETAGAEQ